MTVARLAALLGPAALAALLAARTLLAALLAAWTLLAAGAALLAARTASRRGPAPGAVGRGTVGRGTAAGAARGSILRLGQPSAGSQQERAR